MKTKKWIHAVWAALVMAMASGGAFATDGTITGITVTPMNPKPNEPITVTVQGMITTPGKKCTILFLKGDGQTAQSQVGHAASFPFVFGGQAYPLYVYSQPGTYTIKVYPSPNQLDAKCTGTAQATIKVSDPQPLGGGLKINPGMVSLSDPCPQGWHKVSGKADGAFSCQPNKPIQKIQCPPKTQYFETECSVGCQQVIY